MIVRQHLVQFWILMRYLYQSNLAFWRGNLVCLNYYLISWLKLGSWEKHREEKWCYLTEAFDSVPQERLLIEIHAYGIRGPLPSWLRSDASESFCGGHHSSWTSVLSGVPQCREPCWDPFYLLCILRISQETLHHTPNFLQMTWKCIRQWRIKHDFEELQKDFTQLES